MHSTSSPSRAPSRARPRGEPQTTTLRALVEGALAKVDVAQGGRIKVLPVYGPQPPVACRAPELVEALTHIMRNAVDAIEGEGVVGIRTGGDDAQAWVDISDNGRGIAPERTLFVGNDMLKDLYPARGAGLRTCLFAGDARSLKMRLDDPRCAFEPDAVIDRLDLLPRVLGLESDEGVPYGR